VPTKSNNNNNNNNNNHTDGHGALQWALFQEATLCLLLVL
jgi:hypothetical protein